MLRELYIENIAVIESANVQLSSGLNTLTGETGAGKSIIIDAINAVLGERTSRDLIRTGAADALVSAIFSPDDKTAEKIAEAGYTVEIDGTLMLSRKVTADGKNICKIGGKPATLSVLKELGRLLINIHGQHDSQALLNSDTHYTFLDAVAENSGERAAYTAAYENYKKIAKELSSLSTDEDEKKRTIDLLTYQINELESADIKIGEINALRSEQKKLQNSEKLSTLLQEITAAINGDEENGGAASALNSASLSATQAAEFLPEIKQNAEKLAEIAIDIDELSADFRAAANGLDFSRERLNEIDDRLDELFTLRHKYGDSENEMLTFLTDSKEKLKNINNSDERIAELENELKMAKTQLIDTAAALTKTRKKAGEVFSKSVVFELEFLCMPSAQFISEVTPSTYSKTGADRVEFLISANAGEEPRPLSKVASGGELSRIMLAIKSVLAGHDDIPTLIFDEIDSGISGRAARSVGIKLKEVSKGRQVICITHLAQIAAMADNHMLIEKRTESGRTFTDVVTLKDQARVCEIARIMAGGEMTENLVQTAKELIEFGEKI